MSVGTIAACRRLAIPVLFLVITSYLAFYPHLSGNVWSRYMTVESVVERGTLAIESSPWCGPIDHPSSGPSGTPDIVKFGDHLYSDKPPVLSILAVPLYWVAHQAGLEMTVPSLIWTNWLLVTAIVGLAGTAGLVCLRNLLAMAGVPEVGRDLLTAAAAFGTLLLSYGVTFNNHSVAAGLVMVGFYLVARTIAENPKENKQRQRNRLACGFGGLAAGFAFAVDLPSGGLVAAGLGIWILVRQRRAVVAYGIGMTVPVALHCGFQSLVTGSPLPAEMHTDAFDYPGSYWNTAAGQWRELQPRWQFALEMLVGPQGWLTVTPTLLLCLTGIGFSLRDKRSWVRDGAIICALSVMILVWFYAWGVRRTDIAGGSYGTRHLLAITPLCLFFGGVMLARARSFLLNALFAALLAVSTIYAAKGAEQPWSRIEQRSENDGILAALQLVVPYPYSSYRR